MRLRLIIITLFMLSQMLVWGQTSPFATGEWYRLEVNAEGIYKIDRSFITQVLGINLNGVDPATIKIYGNAQGGTLPQLNALSPGPQLKEVALYQEGLADGSFDQNDFLLFYGVGPHRYDFEDGYWSVTQNIYSRVNYYFLTFGGSTASTITHHTAPASDQPPIHSYVAFAHHEQNLRNINQSGRTWYGEFFSKNEGTSREITFATPALLDSAAVYAKLQAQSEVATSFELKLNNTVLGTVPVASVPIGPYTLRGRDAAAIFRTSASGNTQKVTVTLQTSSTGDQVEVGALDFITLSYRSRLSLDSDPLFFSVPIAGQLTIANTDETTHLWDVTEKNQPVSISLNRFSPVQSGLRRYAAFRSSQAQQPLFDKKIENQNILSLAPSDGLIITHPAFEAQARRLANFRLTHDGLDVAVITTEQVYNDFSSGVQDVSAIRNAAKFYWQKSPSLKYLLLFGDCSYDYLDRLPNNNNFVPIYQSRNSLDPVLSHSSDDYFGFFEDDEGDWIETAAGDHTLEIGVGRIPVNNEKEARDAVDKLIRYARGERLTGSWKNKMTYVVDDGDRNIHIRDAEDLSGYIERRYPYLDINKLYIDAFPKEEISTTRSTSKTTQNKLLESIREGTFVINYIGHGSEEQWAEENVLNLQDIERLSNRDKLPVFLTATCEFGRYDSPFNTRGHTSSGAERLLLNPNGGAIALLTTTRPVFAFTNFLVNAAFHSFFFEKEDGAYARLGDIIRNTKNFSLTGPVNRNFALLGDPMMQLAFPDDEIRLTHINERSINTDLADTLKALDLVTLRGQVRDFSGSVVENFNGTVNITVYDRESTRRTFGHQSSPFDFTVRENIIFNGEASITAGFFESTFTVPKNITYRFDDGRITMFAVNGTETSDATGAYNNLRIGGSAQTVAAETTPPDIELYINDPSTGTPNDQNIIKNKTGASGILYIRVSDESGINTTGLGVGQINTLQIDTGEPESINRYYIAELDSYQKGRFIVPFNDLEPGRHTATINVWDIHNNSNTKTVEFLVGDEPRVQLIDVINYPNPATEVTTIRFSHDRTGNDLEIDISIYNMFGELMLTDQYTMNDSPKTLDGFQIGLPPGKFRPGVYLCRVRVASKLDGAVGEHIHRMIITK